MKLRTKSDIHWRGKSLKQKLNGSSYCTNFFYFDEIGKIKNMYFLTLFKKLVKIKVLGHNCFIFQISSKFKKKL